MAFASAELMADESVCQWADKMDLMMDTQLAYLWGYCLVGQKARQKVDWTGVQMVEKLELLMAT